MRLMKAKSSFLLLSSLILSTAVIAGTVNQASVTTFEDGTAAVAGEVNANFQALITAINDNASRITALESADGANNSVSGNTYTLKQLGIVLSGNNNNLAIINNYVEIMTLVFNSNGTFEASGVAFDGIVRIGDLQVGQMENLANGTPVSFGGTYSQNGSTISTNLGVSLTVSMDGNVLLLTEYDFGVDDDNPAFTRSENSILIGIRVQ